MKRCSGCAEIAIHPLYRLCESCEVNECPACGEYMNGRGFCNTCTADGTKQEIVAASERWARDGGYA
jgi:hypothetical protein